MTVLVVRAPTETVFLKVAVAAVSIEESPLIVPLKIELPVTVVREPLPVIAPEN